MKFALVDGVRQEARPLLVGECIGCGGQTIARCGEVRIHHWAHKGRRRCDPWWETETEWHRSWKNEFPSAWQEVVCHAKDGEKHIADVKTQSGWVLEFQHSHITKEERFERESFYGKLIWVIDGARSPHAKQRFVDALDDGGTNSQFPEVKALPTKKVERLQSWISSGSHVAFDLGNEQLWWLLPGSDESWTYLVSIERSKFVELLRSTDSSGAIKLLEVIEKYGAITAESGAFPSLADYCFIKRR